MATENAVSVITIRGQSAGLKELAADVRALASAQGAVINVSEDVERRTTSVERALNRLQSKYDTCARATKEMENATKVLDRAMEQGLINDERKAELLSLVAIRAVAVSSAFDTLRSKYDEVFNASQNYQRSLAEIAILERSGAVSADVLARARSAASAAYHASVASVNVANQPGAGGQADAQVVAYNQHLKEQAKALEDLRAKYNPLFSAGRTYKATLAEINEANKKGALSDNERAAAIARTKTAFVQQVQTIKGVTPVIDNVGRSTAALNQHIAQFGFQVNDVLTGIASGQPIFQIFAQQTGQVVQALNGPGGFGATLVGIKDKILSWITPTTVAGAAFVAAATLAFTAWNRFDNLQKEILRTTQGLGRIVGLNANQFEVLSQKVAEAGDISVARANDLANALARTGNVDAGNILRIGIVFKDIAATVSGGDLDKGLNDVVRLFGTGKAGLDEINKSITRLHGPQLTAFDDAVKQNRMQEAIKMIIEALPGKMTSFQETTGKAAGAWERLKNIISDIDLALGRAIDKAPGFAATVNKIGAGSNLAGAFGGAEPDLSPPKPGAAAAPTAQPAPLPRFVAQAADIAAVTAQVKELGAANGAANLSMSEMVKVLESASQDIDQQTDQYRTAIAVQNAWNTIKKQGTAADRDAAVQSRNFSEVLSIANHIQQAQSDAQGNRLKNEDLARMAGEAAIKQNRARILSEEAEAAGLQSVEQNRKSSITTTQAANEKQLASQQIIDRWRTSQEKANAAVGDNIDINTRMAGLLFATDNARSVELAGLNAEKEVLQVLGPKWVNYAEALAFVQLKKKQAVEEAAGKQLRSQFEEIKSAGVSAFASIATAIASGTNAMDAMTAGAKQLGSALTTGGINQIAQGNLLLGGAEAIVGLGLTFFGADQEKKAADRKKKLDDAKTQADEAARKAEEINQAISTYLQRITAAAFASQADTLENRLAQFDIKAANERLEAIAKGGAAINLLEQALGLERANIVADWGKKIADDEKAIADRRLGYEDRIFAAANDNNTFAGKVAALERQFSKERADEIAQGGEDLNTLIEAQNAERLRLYQDAADEQLRIQKEAFDDAKAFIEQAAQTINQYLDSLKTGSLSPLSPADKLAAAQSQFSTQLALAQGGNRDALSGITDSAGTLLDAAKGFFASSSAFQNIFSTVTSQLGALPNQVSPEQFIVDAINEQTDTLSAYLASIDLDGDGLISRTEANGTFLQSIFNELDTNGDGQLSKLELVRINTGNTAGSTASTDAYTQSVNSLTAQGNSILSAMNAVANNQYSELVAANNSLATQIASLGNLAKITFNTATLVNFQNTSSHGSGAFRAGGWIGGMGTGTSDSNRIWASRGEFIVNAAQSRIYGPLLERINAGLPLPAIAGAGNDNGLLGEVRALRLEVASLRQENTRATVAAAEHQREGTDGVREALGELVRETKLSSSRAA